MKNLTVKELKAICKEKGIKGYSKLRKQELIELLETRKEELKKRELVFEIFGQCDQLGTKVNTEIKNFSIEVLTDIRNQGIKALEEQSENVDYGIKVIKWYEQEYNCFPEFKVVCTNQEIDELKELTLKELRKEAKGTGIKNYWNIKKNRLVIELLKIRTKRKADIKKRSDLFDQYQSFKWSGDVNGMKLIESHMNFLGMVA